MIEILAMNKLTELDEWHFGDTTIVWEPDENRRPCQGGRLNFLHGEWKGSFHGSLYFSAERDARAWLESLLFGEED